MEKQKTKTRGLHQSNGFFCSRTNSNNPEVKSYAATGATPFIFFDIKKPVFYVVNDFKMGFVK